MHGTETKKLGKLKQKPSSWEETVQAKKAVREEEVKLPGVGFVKQVGLSREWNREGVMDEQSGKSEEEEVMGKGIGESEMEELIPESERVDSRDMVKHNERSSIGLHISNDYSNIVSCMPVSVADGETDGQIQR